MSCLTLGSQILFLAITGGGGNCHWVSRVKFKAELRETVRTVRNRKVIPSANPTKSGTTNPTMYYVYTITL